MRSLNSCLLATLLLPTLALAQTPAQTEQPKPSEPVLQTMGSGWLIAPDYKFSEVDNDFASFAGFYGGHLTDDTLFLGGGFYWLANGSDFREMTYGGAIVEYNLKPAARIRVSARSLFGFGTSTLAVNMLVPDGPNHGPRGPGRNGGRGTTNRLYPVWDDFLVAEPQANVFLSVTPWMRLGVGASYRFVGATDFGFGDRLSGVSGSFSVVLGSF